MKKVLRCYAEGRPGQWEAVCLELDIAVQGDSFEQVFHDLGEAIGQYCEAVMTLPEADDRRRLLNRPAPLSLRVKFLWHALRSLFHDGGDNPKQRAEFTTFCPA